ncbi:hypothetical protein A1O1_03722 [Capronia coronata CBS 617.96]|uniref:Uncharacterized protein n=1 Tax=Capronia coronata CBS 617.96 TaxID=1182541 RepID=W9Z7X5_9EURO|nr:uncharacterized protein A1O1_03722 [Capronia coronata CBS 617.96]EXJ90619.1 hypothetical protein A1O1_03722 [Capronia coronata CBS 617.96]
MASANNNMFIRKDNKANEVKRSRDSRSLTVSNASPNANPTTNFTNNERILQDTPNELVENLFGALLSETHPWNDPETRDTVNTLLSDISEILKATVTAPDVERLIRSNAVAVHIVIGHPSLVTAREEHEAKMTRLHRQRERKLQLEEMKRAITKALVNLEAVEEAEDVLKEAEDAEEAEVLGNDHDFDPERSFHLPHHNHGVYIDTDADVMAGGPAGGLGYADAVLTRKRLASHAFCEQVEVVERLSKRFKATADDTTGSAGNDHVRAWGQGHGQHKIESDTDNKTNLATNTANATAHANAHVNAHPGATISGYRIGRVKNERANLNSWVDYWAPVPVEDDLETQGPQNLKKTYQKLLEDDKAYAAAVTKQAKEAAKCECIDSFRSRF